MANTGLTQGTKQLYFYLGNILKCALLLQGLHKQPRCAHWAYGMGRRRPNANAKHIECTDHKIYTHIAFERAPIITLNTRDVILCTLILADRTKALRKALNNSLGRSPQQTIRGFKNAKVEIFLLPIDLQRLPVLGC